MRTTGFALFTKSGEGNIHSMSESRPSKECEQLGKGKTSMPRFARLARTALLLLVLAGFASCRRPTIVFRETDVVSADPTASTPKPASTPGPPLPDLHMQVYDGDTRKPQDMSFQVSENGEHHRSEFLQLGNTFPGTSFTLTRFQYKTRHNARTDEEEDASELTLFNPKTNQTLVLPISPPKDSLPTF